MRHQILFRSSLLLLLTVLLLDSSLLVRALRQNSRRLSITPKECSSSPLGNRTGICMFSLECQERSGIVIGACVDRFLFGTCCLLANPQNASNPEAPHAPLDPESEPAYSTTRRGVQLITKHTILQQQQQRIPNDANPNIPSSGSDSASIQSPSSLPDLLPIPAALNQPPTSGDSSFEWGVSKDSNQPQKMGALHNPNSPLANGERPTVPTPRDHTTIFPIALETFAHVGDNTFERFNGDNYNKRPSNGQFDGFMESTTLTYPYTTEDSPKLSTFMYIDGLDSDHESTSSSGDYSLHTFYERTTTPIPPNEKNELGDENLNANTENVWSVVMQLSNNPSQSTPLSPLQKTEEILSVHLNSDELLSSLLGSPPLTDGDAPSGPPEDDVNIPPIMDKTPPSSDGGLMTSEDDEEEEEGLSWNNIWKITTSYSVDSSNSNKISASSEEENSLAETTHTYMVEKPSTLPEIPSPSSLPVFLIKDPTKSPSPPPSSQTLKPWASSTLKIHTFTYPEKENYSFGGISMTSETPLGNKQSSQVTEQPTMAFHTFTLPPVGKLTTWFGLDEDPHSMTSTTQRTLGTTQKKVVTNRPEPSTMRTTMRPPTTRRSSTTETKVQTTLQVIPSSSKFPMSSSSFWTSPIPPRTTTTESPLFNLNRYTTETYLYPSTSKRTYTLPPRKKYTTPKTWRTTTSTTTEAPPRTTTSTTTEKPYEKDEEILGSKSTKKPVVDKHSAVLQDDLDTTIDDFVNQVVQELAGSLDTLNLDENLLNSDKFSSSQQQDTEDDLIKPIPSEKPASPTLHPLHVLSDPHFIQNLDKNTGVAANKIPPPPKKRTTIYTTTTTTEPPTTTRKPLDYRKDCGVRMQEKSGRIVGGTASKFGQWPWQALVREATWLGLFSKNKCGGVLIAPKYVLTAAHCQPGFLATLTVVLGDFDISTETDATNSNSVTKNVRRVIVHRDYNAQTFENDIAILELESPVTYQPHIVPICFPHDDEEFIGKKAFVTGWGRLKYGGGVPQQLHQVDVPILNNSDCQQMFLRSGHIKAIRESFICAGYAQGLKDSCEGDSGGPLALQRPSGQWVLAGTVSHGIKCAFPNLPGVYMRMTWYKSWIKRVTGVNL